MEDGADAREVETREAALQMRIADALTNVLPAHACLLLIDRRQHPDHAAPRSSVKFDAGDFPGQALRLGDADRDELGARHHPIDAGLPGRIRSRTSRRRQAAAAARSAGPMATTGP